MSAEYKVTEDRIKQAVAYMTKNPEAKRAKVARQFDVPIQRLRSRLEGRPSKSTVGNCMGDAFHPIKSSNEKSPPPPLGSAWARR